MIKQNKGEWSELYVFLKLLGDGVLYAADADLNKIEDLYYPLIEILRKENENTKHYVKDDINIKVKDENNNPLLELPATEFETKAIVLYNAIKNNKGAFSVEEIENFINFIQYTKIKANSAEKGDITIVLHDNKTYRNDLFSFSIKSYIGGAPTLFNPGPSTNFTYKIIGNLSDEDIKQINSIDDHSKIISRIEAILNKNCRIEFFNVEHETCKANLQMIDTLFPLIMSQILFNRYISNKNGIKELTQVITEQNPCNYDLNIQPHSYEFKIKNFLTSSALGMTAATPWSGLYRATGGCIIAKEDGETLCYHAYNYNDFQDYLYNNTRIETPSTSRYDFGYVYKENGENYIKLNLQVRFI